MVKYAVGNYNPANPEVVDLKSLMYFNSLFQAEMYYIDNYILLNLYEYNSFHQNSNQ